MQCGKIRVAYADFLIVNDFEIRQRFFVNLNTYSDQYNHQARTGQTFQKFTFPTKIDGRIYDKARVHSDIAVGRI